MRIPFVVWKETISLYILSYDSLESIDFGQYRIGDLGRHCIEGFIKTANHSNRCMCTLWEIIIVACSMI